VSYYDPAAGVLDSVDDEILDARNMRKTKIVATLGPTSSSFEQVRARASAGLGSTRGSVPANKRGRSMRIRARRDKTFMFGATLCACSATARTRFTKACMAPDSSAFNQSTILMTCKLAQAARRCASSATRVSTCAA
jgi:hypothetical protein